MSALKHIEDMDGVGFEGYGDAIFGFWTGFRLGAIAGMFLRINRNCGSFGSLPDRAGVYARLSVGNEWLYFAVVKTPKI